MSKKAKEAALRAYPYDGGTKGWICKSSRPIFIKGYEQAEKDLAPLIEAAMIVYEAWNGGTMDDVRREMIELGKQIMEAKK